MVFFRHSCGHRRGEVGVPAHRRGRDSSFERFSGIVVGIGEQKKVLLPSRVEGIQVLRGYQAAAWA